MPKKLNQIVAIEKSTKARIYHELQELHKSTQKAEPFNGFIKTYRKKDEDGEDYPQERKRVQLNGEEILDRVMGLLSEMMDIEAVKDFANCSATVDLTLPDGTVLLTSVPATFLLYLEKQLVDIHTFTSKLPILDDTEDWSDGPVVGHYVSSPVETFKTKKVQKALVLYQATDKHPAQTQLISDDVVVGYWNNVKESGALKAQRKEDILRRIDGMLKAVKQAREQANEVVAPDVSVGAKLLAYLFNKS